MTECDGVCFWLLAHVTFPDRLLHVDVPQQLSLTESFVPRLIGHQCSSWSLAVWKTSGYFLYCTQWKLSLVSSPCTFVAYSTKFAQRAWANFVLQATNTQGLGTRLVKARSESLRARLKSLHMSVVKECLTMQLNCQPYDIPYKESVQILL